MKSRIGHYDVLAELGRGGMGVVYQGYEPALDRHVAIKVLSQSLAHDPSIKERFLREARSMAALNDPHIIQIYFIGEDEGQPYFAMEFIEGESLSSYLKREGKLSPQNAGRIIHQTALGLATAHDKGVIHRDIKPGNLMLTARGNVKIADFGIALSSQDFAKKLTSTGEFVGTPGYLSPEVCTGNPVDQRSDIFSLGIVLFEVLTGRMPFTDESPLGLLLEVVRAEIPDVRQLNADVDPQMVEILTRMTAKDPANRYASCHELAEALSHHPLLARPWPAHHQGADPGRVRDAEPWRGVVAGFASVPDRAAGRPARAGRVHHGDAAAAPGPADGAGLRTGGAAARFGALAPAEKRRRRVRRGRRRARAAARERGCVRAALTRAVPQLDVRLGLAFAGGARRRARAAGSPRLRRPRCRPHR
jgi:serine/threonine protein kinase